MEYFNFPSSLGCYLLYFVSFIGLVIFAFNVKALLKEKAPLYLIHKTSERGLRGIIDKKMISGNQGFVFAGGGSVEVSFIGKSGDYMVCFPSDVYPLLFKRQRLNNRFLASIFSTVPCNEDSYVTKKARRIVILDYKIDKNKINITSATLQEYPRQEAIKRRVVYICISFHKWFLSGLILIAFITIAMELIGINPMHVEWFEFLFNLNLNALVLGVMLWLSVYVCGFFKR